MGPVLLRALKGFGARYSLYRMRAILPLRTKNKFPRHPPIANFFRP